MNIYNYLVLLVYIIACNPSEGRPGMSESIEESKKREVYVCDYKSPKNPLIINDTLKIEVTEAWVEKKWAYDSNPNDAIILNGYQLIVHTADKLDEDFTFSWRIGVDFNRYFRSCGYSCMMTDFDSLPKIVENWEIQQGRDLYKGASHRIIGQFALQKKD